MEPDSSLPHLQRPSSVIHFDMVTPTFADNEPYVSVIKANVHHFVCIHVNSNESLQWSINGSRRWHDIIVIIGY